MKPQELDMLYSLAKNALSGRGIIMDAGIFLGASTRCFALGIAQNPKASNKAIKSYELGEKNKFMGSNPQIDGIEVGESFGHILVEQLGKYKQVELRIGDITKEKHTNNPIELMFLDVLKVPKIMHHINAEFMPYLVDGGILVQQDYYWPFGWWINLWMELFSDFFEVIDTAETSVAFRLLKKLPPEAFTPDCINSLSTEEIVEVLSNPTFKGDRLDQIVAQKIKISHLLFWRKNYVQAAAQLDRIEDTLGYNGFNECPDQLRDRLINDLNRLRRNINQAQSK